MSSLIKKLSKIDIKTKYGVYGWVRNAEKELKLSNIPLLVSSICILYYHEEEIFARCGKTVTLSADKKHITGGYAWDNVNVGNNVIDSMTDSIYEWTMTSTSKDTIVVGITSVSNIDCNKVKFWFEYGEEDGHNYLLCSRPSLTWKNEKWYDCNQSNWKKYGATERNKIKICLDLKQQILRFNVNGEDKDVSCDQIVRGKDIKYRLVVSLCHGVSVRLIDFKSK